MWVRRSMWIVWPAFLAAGVMEVLIFTFFDPQDMLWLGQALAWSSTAIYTLSFFVIWAVFLLAGYLMVLLSLSSSELNRRPQAPVGYSSDWRLKETVEACYPNNA